MTLTFSLLCLECCGDKGSVNKAFLYMKGSKFIESQSNTCTSKCNYLIPMTQRRLDMDKYVIMEHTHSTVQVTMNTDLSCFLKVYT